MKPGVHNEAAPKVCVPAQDGPTPQERDLAMFLSYWRERAGAAFPSRRDIDPVDIPHLLSHLLLTDAEHGGMSFRVRLAGTGLNDANGGELSGTVIDGGAEHGGANGLVRRILGGALRHRVPVYAGGLWHTSRDVWLFGRGVAAPLSDDNVGVTGVIVCFSRFTYAMPEALLNGQYGFMTPLPAAD